MSSCQYGVSTVTVSIRKKADRQQRGADHREDLVLAGARGQLAGQRSSRP